MTTNLFQNVRESKGNNKSQAQRQAAFDLMTSSRKSNTQEYYDSEAKGYRSGYSFHPSEWQGDGIDHINIWKFGSTELGQVLDLDYHLSWSHDRYGQFSSVSAFWYFITSVNQDSRIRSLTGKQLQAFVRRQEETGLRINNVTNLKGIILDAMYQRISGSPTLRNEVINSNLPFDQYSVTRDTGVMFRRQVSNWLVPGMETIRFAMQAGVRPDLTPFFDDASADMYVDIPEIEPPKPYQSSNLLRKLKDEERLAKTGPVKGPKVMKEPKAVKVDLPKKKEETIGAPGSYITADDFKKSYIVTTYTVGFANKVDANALLWSNKIEEAITCFIHCFSSAAKVGKPLNPGMLEKAAVLIHYHTYADTAEVVENEDSHLHAVLNGDNRLRVVMNEEESAMKLHYVYIHVVLNEDLSKSMFLSTSSFPQPSPFDPVDKEITVIEVSDEENTLGIKVGDETYLIADMIPVKQRKVKATSELGVDESGLHENADTEVLKDAPAQKAELSENESQSIQLSK